MSDCIKCGEHQASYCPECWDGLRAETIKAVRCLESGRDDLALEILRKAPFPGVNLSAHGDGLSLCPVCEGGGLNDGKPCPNCNGVGYVTGLPGMSKAEPIEYVRVEPEDAVERLIKIITKGPKLARAIDEALRNAAKVMAMGLDPGNSVEGPKGKMFLTKRGVESIFEAVAGGGYIDLRDYVAVRSEKSTCGECGSKVVLLSRLKPDDGPEYYVCHCGMLALVGYGILRHETGGASLEKEEEKPDANRTKAPDRKHGR